MKLILGLFGVLLLIVIIGTYSRSLIFGNLGFNNPSVSIDNHSFTVDEAKTQADQEVGLSNRDSLDTDKGMLFIFPKSDIYSFWMKNMKFPLDIIYIQNNKIVDIAADQKPAPSGIPDNQIPVITPNESANYVLEINAGLSSKYGFKKGDSVSFSNL